MAHSSRDNGIATHHTNREVASRSTVMLMFAGDMIATFIASILAFYSRFALPTGFRFSSNYVDLADYMIHMSLGVFSMAAILFFRGAYSMEMITRFRYGAISMLACGFWWGILFAFISLFFQIEPSISRVWVVHATFLVAISLASWRYFFCKYFVGRTLLQSARRKTLIVGWNSMAEQIHERSETSTYRGTFFPFRVRSVISMEKDKDLYLGGSKKIFRGSGLDTLEKQLTNGRHDTVIIANTDLPSSDVLRIQEICGREMIDVMVIPDFMHTLRACLQVETFAGLPLLTHNRRKVNTAYNSLTKRLFDIAGALVGLILAAPIIGFYCWRVHRESPGPVFYRQTRIGENGRHFDIIKIRSMRLDAEEESGATWCKEDDERRLEVGAFIRRYNIDELPQFWNVLKGEMSLVGPRPERPELIMDFKNDISFYNVRHTVKPGITGWAQVNGWRGDTSLESRIACDLEYIERWSLWFDLYICLRTLGSTKNAY